MNALTNRYFHPERNLLQSPCSFLNNLFSHPNSISLLLTSSRRAMASSLRINDTSLQAAWASRFSTHFTLSLSALSSVKRRTFRRRSALRNRASAISYHNNLQLYTTTEPRLPTSPTHQPAPPPRTPHTSTPETFLTEELIDMGAYHSTLEDLAKGEPLPSAFRICVCVSASCTYTLIASYTCIPNPLVLILHLWRQFHNTYPRFVTTHCIYHYVLPTLTVHLRTYPSTHAKSHNSCA